MLAEDLLQKNYPKSFNTAADFEASPLISFSTESALDN